MHLTDSPEDAVNFIIRILGIPEADEKPQRKKR